MLFEMHSGPVTNCCGTHRPSVPTMLPTKQMADSPNHLPSLTRTSVTLLLSLYLSHHLSLQSLAQPSACTRDLPLLKDLGVNAVRIYSVDNTQNHDACMKMLSDAGIYTIIDLSLPLNGSINRAAPAWTTNLLNLYIETIDVFSKYDNVSFVLPIFGQIPEVTVFLGPCLQCRKRSDQPSQ